MTLLRVPRCAWSGRSGSFGVAAQAQDAPDSRRTCRRTLLPLCEADGREERDAVEQVGEPDRGTGQLQALDADGEHDDGEQRPDDVEASVVELGRAEERGGEGR